VGGVTRPPRRSKRSDATAARGGEAGSAAVARVLCAQLPREAEGPRAPEGEGPHVRGVPRLRSSRREGWPSASPSTSWRAGRETD
jgi:hypothetical protein